MRTAAVAITRNGARLGARLRDTCSVSDLFVLRKHQASRAIPFDDLRELLAKLWGEYDGIVCIMATGIVVRMTAPLLRGKDRDPAVVVMDEAGRFAVSLLSGHLGGGNALARDISAATGATPVITTATDVNGLPSFDMVAKDEGWVIEDLSRVKRLNALLLEGEEIAAVDPTERLGRHFSCANISYHRNFVEALRSSARGFVFVTNRRLPPQAQSDALLVLRPRNLVLGMGCNSGTTETELEEVAEQHLRRLFLSPRSIRCIATAKAKENEPGLVAFAARLGVPLLVYGSEELNAVAAPSPPSIAALKAIGAAGVAEPAAILASGCGNLLLRKVKSGNVTLALAEIPDDTLTG